jgi:RNA polymerase sigma-70 factor (ECF subfamily)
MGKDSEADSDRSEFRTNISLIKSVRDPADTESWRKFHDFYAPLLRRYLKRLGLEENSANDVYQDVFVRLLENLPTFELDKQRGRFRSYLWKLTYSALVDRARRVKVRAQAEEQWVRRFREESDSESRRVQDELNEINRQQILKRVLPRVRSTTSHTAWRCFEERLIKDRPGAEIAAEMAISTDAVYVYASRVMKAVRRQCSTIADELGDEPIDWLPREA